MDELKIVGIVCISFALFLYGSVAGINNLTIHSDIEKALQLKSDFYRSKPGSDDHILGQVAKFNQKVVSMKKYNTLWWAKFMVPDEWDSVELIDVNRK